MNGPVTSQQSENSAPGAAPSTSPVWLLCSKMSLFMSLQVPSGIWEQGLRLPLGPGSLLPPPGSVPAFVNLVFLPHAVALSSLGSAAQPACRPQGLVGAAPSFSRAPLGKPDSSAARHCGQRTSLLPQVNDIPAVGRVMLWLLRTHVGGLLRCSLGTLSCRKAGQRVPWRTSRSHQTRDRRSSHQPVSCRLLNPNSSCSKTLRSAFV